MWPATLPCILFVNLTRTVSEFSLCKENAERMEAYNGTEVRKRSVNRTAK